MDSFYKDLIQILPDIVYHIDSDGNFIYLNDSIRKLGYAPEELVGRHFSTIIDKDQIATVTRELFFSNHPPVSGKAGFVDERRTGTRLT